MVQNGMAENKQEIAVCRNAPRFVPAGQSTQMIIGATPENDYQILNVAESLYKNFELKRVFYSAFIHVNEDSNFCKLSAVGSSKFTLILSARNPIFCINSWDAPGMAFTWIYP